MKTYIKILLLTTSCTLTYCLKGVSMDKKRNVNQVIIENNPQVQIKKCKTFESYQLFNAHKKWDHYNKLYFTNSLNSINKDKVEFIAKIINNIDILQAWDGYQSSAVVMSLARINEKKYDLLFNIINLLDPQKKWDGYDVADMIGILDPINLHFRYEYLLRAIKILDPDKKYVKEFVKTLTSIDTEKYGSLCNAIRNMDPKKNWNTYEVNEVVKCLGAIDTNKYESLYEFIMNLTSQKKADGYFVRDVLLALAPIEEKDTYKFLYDVVKKLDPQGLWTGYKTARIIEIMRHVDKSQHNHFFKKIEKEGPHHLWTEHQVREATLNLDSGFVIDTTIPDNEKYLKISNSERIAILIEELNIDKNKHPLLCKAIEELDPLRQWSEYGVAKFTEILLSIDQTHYEYLFGVIKTLGASNKWMGQEVAELMETLDTISQSRHEYLFKAINKLDTEHEFDGYDISAVLEALVSIDQDKHEYLFKAIHRMNCKKKWPGYYMVQIMDKLADIPVDNYEEICNFMLYWDPQQEWEEDGAVYLIEAIGKIDSDWYEYLADCINKLDPSEEWQGGSISYVMEALHRIDEDKHEYLIETVKKQFSSKHPDGMDYARVMRKLDRINQDKHEYLFKTIEKMDPKNTYSVTIFGTALTMLDRIDQDKHENIIKSINTLNLKECSPRGLKAVMKTIDCIDQDKHQYLFEAIKTLIPNNQVDGTEISKVMKILDNTDKNKHEILFEAIKTLDLKNEFGKEWNCGTISSILSSLMYYDSKEVPALSKRVLEFIKINPVPSYNVHLAVAVLGGHNNESELHNFGDLLTKAFPETESMSRILQGLAMHEPLYRKTVLSLITKEKTGTENLIEMTAFIPETERVPFFKANRETGSAQTELLSYFGSVIVLDAKDNGIRKESLLNHWKNLLTSQNIHAAKWLTNFILNNDDVLGLDQEEDNSLYQWAIRIKIQLEDHISEKSPYNQFLKLLEKRKIFNAKDITTPIDIIAGKHVSLNPVFFQNLVSNLDFNPDSVPEVSEEMFNKLCDSLKEKDNELNYTLQTNSSRLLLKDKISYLSMLFKSPHTNFMASQWKCVVNYILNGPLKPSDPKNKKPPLSEQQERLAGALNAIQNCPTGMDEGIRYYYLNLPLEFKLKAKNGNIKNEIIDEVKLDILKILSTGMEKLLTQGEFLRKILNYEIRTEIAQESHQIKYLLGLIAHHVGIQWQVKIDINAQVLLVDLIKMTAQEAVQRVYDMVTPQVVINYLQKEINSKIHESNFCNSIKSLLMNTNQMTEDLWEIEMLYSGEDDYIGKISYKGIKEKGVLELLLTLGAFQVNECKSLWDSNLIIKNNK